jgi:hypothetical protein
MDLAKGKIEDTSDAFSVSVAVRIRPLNGTEKIESPQICVTPIPEQNIVVVGKDRQWRADRLRSSRAAFTSLSKVALQAITLQFWHMDRQAVAKLLPWAAARDSTYSRKT